MLSEKLIITLNMESFSLDQHQETFSVQAANAGKKNDDPIRLNIAEISLTKKLIEQERIRQGKLTGNPLVDFFYRVNDWLVEHSSIHYRVKATFFRLLAVMINAGVPLIRALDTLAAQMIKEVKLSRVIMEMARKVETGKSLSEALRTFPDIFDEAQVGMVHSGEATGQLNQVLGNIATQLEKSAGLRTKVISAMIYPLVVMTLLVAVVFVIMLVVVPKIKEFFGQSGRELPFITQALISVSDFFQAYWILMLIGITGLVLFIQFWKKTPIGRYQWDDMKLRIPFFGKLLQKSLLSQFMRQFSDLLGSGIQIIHALRIITGSMNNAVYRKRLELAAQDIEQGIPLAETLNDPRLFPGMIVNMIQVGEQTAHLEVIAEKVAEYFDDEVDAMVKGLSKSFEPVILIVIGVVVGGIVAAVMLPIMDLSNLSGDI